ncbi:uncharacterized protein LOC121253475 [Juglans microcarpa x Juglans regia]|uniref:uncharacterized protein LOC121253475 n=1 Tax=Juglans microcarpa x Juglans regia TaxID=2249226 RepID=UPI001B7E394E|nr:uncharacterized protein LOC121253475 [Juglans microcarpa x Juglans regia]
MWPNAVSSPLTRVEEDVQLPVYNVNRAFRGVEIGYPQTEMLAFALVVTARQLRPYFQAHPIKVQTDIPQRKILQKPDTSGRMTNWAIELSEFEVEYLPRTAIKGQVTNNKTEYEALLLGLTIVRSLGATKVEVKVDSQIVVGCSELRIKAKYSSPGHPQANGQVEATNKTLLNILKNKLGEQKGKWVEELPSTLWAYRTSVRTPTGESPFSLVYGAEAMIPAEVVVPIYRVQHYDLNQNNERLRENLDFLEERREEAVC